VYQGVNPGQIIVSGNNTSAKNMADVDQKGMTTVRTFLKTTGTIKRKKQVGDRNDLPFEDEVVVATAIVWSR
jgi:hypothetical protein